MLLAQRVIAGDALAQEGLGGGDHGIGGAGGDLVHGFILNLLSATGPEAARRRRRAKAQ
jgi:hypothetical protein